VCRISEVKRQRFPRWLRKFIRALRGPGLNDDSQTIVVLIKPQLFAVDSFGTTSEWKSLARGWILIQRMAICCLTSSWPQSFQKCHSESAMMLAERNSNFVKSRLRVKFRTIMVLTTWVSIPRLPSILVVCLVTGADEGGPALILIYAAVLRLFSTNNLLILSRVTFSFFYSLLNTLNILDLCAKTQPQYLVYVKSSNKMATFFESLLRANVYQNPLYPCLRSQRGSSVGSWWWRLARFLEFVSSSSVITMSMGCVTVGAGYKPIRLIQITASCRAKFHCKWRHLTHLRAR
jgi:hypothetical protein